MEAEAFTAWDWAIVSAYLLLVVAIGAWPRPRTDVDDFFLASRRMPMLAVSISLLDTTQ